MSGDVLRVVAFADEKLQFSPEFRGLLLIRWSDSAQIGSVVLLLIVVANQPKQPCQNSPKI